MTQPPPSSRWRQVLVAPSRLRPGGDINASYSADRIAFGRPLSKPFTWEHALWVATGGLSQQYTDAYRLTPQAEFPGKPISYNEKVWQHDGESARADPLGFYHGMQVRLRGQPWVLTGPPVTFRAGSAEAHPTPEQLSLFE